MYQERSIILRHSRRDLDELVRPLIWRDTAPIDISVTHLDGEPVSFAQATARDFAPGSVGEPWGPAWGTSWFHLTGTVPEKMAGKTVDVHVDLGFYPGLVGFHAEGTVWSADGTVLGGVHPERRWVRIADSAKGGETIDLYVEAAANPLFVGTNPTPYGDRSTAPISPLYSLHAAELAVRDDDVAQLILAWEFVLQLAEDLRESDPLSPRALAALTATAARIDPSDVRASAAHGAEPVLALMADPGAPRRHRATAIGHAHIDTAWLWPLRETKRKVLRTFTNQLNLMDTYPEYRFGCSQAQQYQWLADEHPEVLDRIRAKVVTGQWVPLGGSWVEADGNLPSGESLVRQLLHGQRFFEKHFGITCTEGWIPDVFGYSGALPQIMRLSGLQRFVTQKLSWNRTNKFPHHTFTWEGIDGTPILTHFPPADTYNAEVRPAELRRIERGFRDHGRSRESLLVFGHGDGGGGPTREMIERLRMGADTDGLVRLRPGSPAEFFADAEAECEIVPAPSWRGELYFEMHRGTYTSQAATKRGNRRCETLLRQAELFSVAAFGATAEGGYPSDELEAIWNEVLTLQFHDILPGSSIAWVHREAEAAYDRLVPQIETLIERALTALVGSAQKPGDPALVNPAPHARAEVVIADGGDAIWAAAPAHGLASTSGELPAGIAPVTASQNPDGTGTIDNGIVHIEWDADGQLTSIVDLRIGRQVLRPGGLGNSFELYEDRPIEYDAWDIEPYYRDRVTVLSSADSVTLTDAGPLVALLAIRRTHGDTTIDQHMVVRAGSARIDFVSEIDWHQNEQLLKAAFDVDVHADNSTAEIQFGTVDRPVHVNTTWDLARFEICAHRFLDLSEPNWGVALLNDGKYGHDTRGGSLRISLLRAPNFPDPNTDRGIHRFTHSLYPHLGDLAHSDVPAEGFRLNNPMRWAKPARGTAVSSPNAAGAGAMPESIAASDTDTLIIDTVKAAADGSGDWIVRCYEAVGGRADAVITFGAAFGRVETVDLLERPLDGPASPTAELADARTVRVSARPFQLVTLRLTPAQS